MDKLEIFYRRRSIRKYKDRPVEKALLEKVVDAGRVAPTARGIQPCEFIVVTDPEKKAELADLAEYGKFIRQAAACIVVISAEAKYYLEDGAAATENILLAAAELELGACWVAGDKKPYAGQVLSLLGVPGDSRLISLISVGYPDEEARPHTDKKPLSEVLHWEKY